jgi:predicted RNase H-like nuclease (RuvC/YqgF family)
MGLTTETLLALRQKAVTKPAHTVQWSAAQIVALCDEVLAGRARVEEVERDAAELAEHFRRTHPDHLLNRLAEQHTALCARDAEVARLRARMAELERERGEAKADAEHYRKRLVEWQRRAIEAERRIERETGPSPGQSLGNRE